MGSTMTTSENKPKEYWVYEGVKNCKTLNFVYKNRQQIKVLAPDNWQEFHVIEHSAYQQALEQIAKLEKALSRIQAQSELFNFAKDTQRVSNISDISMQALAELKKWRGEND